MHSLDKIYQFYSDNYQWVARPICVKINPENDEPYFMFFVGQGWVTKHFSDVKEVSYDSSRTDQ